VGSSLGAKSSPSVVILADASKHIIQIIQLLDERRMSFSFCLNRNEVLILSGFGLLFQGLELNRQGKLIKDNQRLVCSVIELLERASAPGAAEFKKVACSMLSIDGVAKENSQSTLALQPKPVAPMPAPRETTKSARKQLQAIASRFSFGGNRMAKQEQNVTRRATVPPTGATIVPAFARNNSQLSASSARSEPAMVHAARQHTVCPPAPARGDSVLVQGPRQRPTAHREPPIRLAATMDGPNLDYLPFGNDPVPADPMAQRTDNLNVSTTEWERLLGSLDSGQSNIYDGIYGGSAAGSAADMLSTNHATSFDGGTSLVRSPDAAWSDQYVNLGLGPVRSVLSISEESLTSGSGSGSGEDRSSSSGDLGLGAGGTKEYRGIMIPHGDGGFGGLEGLDGNFGL